MKKEEEEEEEESQSSDREELSDASISPNEDGASGNSDQGAIIALLDLGAKRPSGPTSSKLMTALPHRSMVTRAVAVSAGIRTNSPSPKVSFSLPHYPAKRPTAIPSTRCSLWGCDAVFIWVALSRKVRQCPQAPCPTGVQWADISQTLLKREIART